MKARKLPSHIVDIRNNIKSGKEKLSFHWFQTPQFPNQWVIQAASINLPYPIGIMWVDSSLNGAKGISNVYVSEDYRQCGIATQLLKHTWEWDKTVKIIYTGSGNGLSTPWLKKLGFVKDEIFGWKLTREQWNKYENK